MMRGWEKAVTDLGSGACSFLNERTGEAYSDDEEDRGTAAVYEVTPHRFRPLTSSGSEPCICSCCEGTGGDRFGVCPLCDGHGSLGGNAYPERADLWCPGSDTAFLIRNLLSPEECDEIISQAEAFGMESCGYNRRIRVTDRVSFMGEKLGELLFERARPFLTDILIPDFLKGPEGCPESLLYGLWQPVGLNPCFRACRYSPGGFFAPHHDGGFDPSDFHRSIKTFMIYLNDDFEGGATNFYNASQSRYKTGLPKNQIFSLQPEKGSCLVFNHCITHDGGELTSGLKHILRTEVMYRHCSRFDQRRTDGGEDSDSSFENEGPEVDESLM